MNYWEGSIWFLQLHCTPCIFINTFITLTSILLPYLYSNFQSIRWINVQSVSIIPSIFSREKTKKRVMKASRAVVMLALVQSSARTIGTWRLQAFDIPLGELNCASNFYIEDLHMALVGILNILSFSMSSSNSYVLPGKAQTRGNRCNRTIVDLYMLDIVTMDGVAPSEHLRNSINQIDFDRPAEKLSASGVAERKVVHPMTVRLVQGERT